ncbi:MAG: DEAD/DEAH box helicase family protein [bacterium]
MPQTTIDRLVINSPYEKPKFYWHYDRVTRLFDRLEGRRDAGYVIATPHSKAFDDPGIFMEIPLVNKIRPRVDAWKAAGYPGVTSITKRLLEYWQDPIEYDIRRFFFCQLEAIETLIWLAEAPASEKVGIQISGDGGLFQRLCCKMATGSGKTIIMAMLIAWQILNKMTYPQDTSFSKNVLVIAPGLTVRNRLAVLKPAQEGNFYEAFRVVPPDMLDTLRQGKVMVHNWHVLSWESAEQLKRKRGVDKRGAKSDEAYTREVLGSMANARNLLVINDEAHHAWRMNPEAVAKYLRMRDMKDSAEEATVWIGGLDRIQRSRGILKCYDFSATPFAPSGGKSDEETLYNWIVSDFGLNDAIESGLVKTPRVVVRDDAVPDAATYRSRLYHIYNDDEVKADLTRAEPPETPLPDLVSNAYALLGADWKETQKIWKESGRTTPPVMITVCNRTETAARINFAFINKKIHFNSLFPELCDPENILHIDSKVLAQAESRTDGDGQNVPAETGDETADGEPVPERKLSKGEMAELLRQKVDTVGKTGQPGEQIHNVISVGMLSEGWDAKTVTHIMGLRAFTSQLLCEQVVGRGLRRTVYEVNPETGLFEPEYVNIFGVPFTFLPHEDTGDDVPPPPKPTTEIRVLPERKEFEITWPNIVRIEHEYQSQLSLDLAMVPGLVIDAGKTAQVAELAPLLDGKPDVTKVSKIDLEKLAREYRTQRIIFETARDVFDQMKHEWKGSREVLLAQLVQLVEKYIRSDKIQIIPPLFYQDEMERRLIITLNMSRVVNHIITLIKQENSERLIPVFNREHPIRSTEEMNTWRTSKPCEWTIKSHINLCVFDSAWESADEYAIDNSENVAAWVKNDHIGFEIYYLYKGVVQKYRPDFLIRVQSGEMLVVETKGQATDQDKAKWAALDEWIEAVNAFGGFGVWRRVVTMRPGEIKDVVMRG